MSKAFFIDSAARQVVEIDLPDNDFERLWEIQRLVGGHIEIAHQNSAGDTVFVDEEGTFKGQKHFFRLAPRGDYPFSGSGVVVGPERYDQEGEFIGNADVTLSLEQMRRAVTFLDRAHADAWAKGNANEPAITFTAVNPDGTVTREIIARIGRIFGSMPRPEGEDDDDQR